ncbi:interferon-induced very large GTPase 1-like isoform X2 [Hyperolius riggenbachi]|uniref:interferon-induced very large GTPase 1-like isoform X2 n=1 Tax=Hyperolius riggenbachi TaxID=752182 RepID=UPI0035A38E8F
MVKLGLPSLAFLCIVCFANASENPESRKRKRWVVMFSPLVIGVLALIMLVYRKFFKKPDSKKKDEALEGLQPEKPTTSNAERQDLRNPLEILPKTAAQGKPPPRQQHWTYRSPMASSSGSGPQPLSAVTSYNENRASSIHSDSTESRRDEEERLLPKHGTQGSSGNNPLWNQSRMGMRNIPKNDDPKIRVPQHVPRSSYVDAQSRKDTSTSPTAVTSYIENRTPSIHSDSTESRRNEEERLLLKHGTQGSSGNNPAWNQSRMGMRNVPKNNTPEVRVPQHVPRSSYGDAQSKKGLSSSPTAVTSYNENRSSSIHSDSTESRRDEEERLLPKHGTQGSSGNNPAWNQSRTGMRNVSKTNAPEVRVPQHFPRTSYGDAQSRKGLSSSPTAVTSYTETRTPSIHSDSTESRRDEEERLLPKHGTKGSSGNNPSWNQSKTVMKNIPKNNAPEVRVPQHFPRTSYGDAQSRKGLSSSPTAVTSYTETRTLFSHSDSTESRRNEEERLLPKHGTQGSSAATSYTENRTPYSHSDSTESRRDEEERLLPKHGTQGSSGETRLGYNKPAPMEIPLCNIPPFTTDSRRQNYICSDSGSVTDETRPGHNYDISVTTNAPGRSVPMEVGDMLTKFRRNNSIEGDLDSSSIRERPRKRLPPTALDVPEAVKHPKYGVKSSETSTTEDPDTFYEDETRRGHNYEVSVTSNSSSRSAPMEVGDILTESRRNNSIEGDLDSISTKDETRLGHNYEVSVTSNSSSRSAPMEVGDILTESRRNNSIEGDLDSISTKDPIKKKFLEKLMALDVTARNICLQNPDLSDQSSNASFDLTEPESWEIDLDFSSGSNGLNPLDVLCNVLRGSDNFHQQEIVTKLSMCQFAIPLLLPDGDGSHCTFMLWAMRDIVKKWRPQSQMGSKGFTEDNLVNISMPIFSFARLGTCSLSKSKLLNQILSQSDATDNYFVHRDMAGGNIKRKQSDGLVEISWYFPVGQEYLDIFPNPLALLNLRGDLEEYAKQFDFLTKISSAVFIFIENIDERHYNLLSQLVQKTQQIFFIMNSENMNKEMFEFLKDLAKKHKKTDKFIGKNRNVNDSQVVKMLRSKMKAEKTFSLEEIKIRAAEFGFNVDEDSKECEKTKKAAINITCNIKDVMQFKRSNMKLQGEAWKQLTKMEKELCRMRELQDRDVEEYQSQLKEEMLKIRNWQSTQQLSNAMNLFLEALRSFSPTEQKLFLKWLKIKLDSLGRKHLAELNDAYRAKYSDPTKNPDDLIEIDQKIADGSLGVEHFIRELGQFYEVGCSVGKQRPLMALPGIAADLLLDGFPLELIDGDASNIPLQWITDVFTELNNKMGGQCTVRVITVLGVQSTGKSTLLNTMFDLQNPVASGRCTRGAFMTLLNAKEKFQEDLGCDYVMVIDTEGLKSMELASLQGSYEHDNELATLVVGLSDVTIVNMAMENTEEMKDILQIVVHAFLRMKEIGKKSSCQFVHQNVSDVSAHVKNQKAREKFLEQLNEMTVVSARMEKKVGVTAFSDIIHCDINNDSWYIPGLWHGIPPMAFVNFGYSESIQELKKSITRYLHTMTVKPQNISQFTEWLKSLWNAVKHEKFIFSFRNRLVTEAYNQLCIQYSDCEWRFQKYTHDWMIKTETMIFNLPSDQLQSTTWNTIKNEMKHLLDKEEHIMLTSLEQYFENDCDNAHLLEAFKVDFFQSVKYLRRDLENVLLDKCRQTIEIQKERCQIQAVQERYINIIEEKVSDIMEKIKRNKYAVKDGQLEIEFGIIWKNATSVLPQSKLQIRNLDRDILQQLKRDIRCNDSLVIQKLDSITSLQQYKEKEFSMDISHLYSDSDWNHAQAVAFSLLKKCQEKIFEIVNFRKDFNDIHSQELLKIINNHLKNHSGNLQTTKMFELDLKLYILSKAAVEFQKMHEDFVQRNDPRSYLEQLKPQYFSMFQNMFQQRNECQRRARQFCVLCLKPAIIDYINRCLGKEVVDGILQKNGPQEFKNRNFLQLAVLKKLLQDNSHTQYEQYINNYERFMKGWISQYLAKHYKDQNTIRKLQESILKGLIILIKQALNDPKALQAKNIADFLTEFCNILKTAIVISQNDMKVIIFQSDLNIAKQFSKDTESFLHALVKEVQQEVSSQNIETTLSQLTLKPQDELFRKVIGCGKQCPFCKAPCEAGGADHKHFASVHRPRGLAQHVNQQTQVLDHSICSTNINSNKSFTSEETGWNPHPYKDYQKYYPDWVIYPETTGSASVYWKFVLKKFNHEFASLYNAKPANIPKDWQSLTERSALESLKNTYTTTQKTQPNNDTVWL